MLDQGLYTKYATNINKVDALLDYLGISKPLMKKFDKNQIELVNNVNL